MNTKELTIEISGYSGSGKTTMALHILAILKAEGFNVSFVPEIDDTSNENLIAKTSIEMMDMLRNRQVTIRDNQMVRM